MSNLSADVLQHYFKTIADSILFDANFYSNISGINADRGTLIKHYIEIGESSGLQPSAGFDPVLYELANPDVKAAGVNKLFHYIAHGKSELRFANKDEVRKAALYIKESGFFDEEYYVANEKLLIPDLDPCEEQLALWRLDRNPNGYFESCFYAGLYPDVAGQSISPMHHYLKIGKGQCRVANFADYEARHEFVSQHLDRRFYLKNAPSLSNEDDLVRHYISEGYFAGLDPMKTFSIDYYGRRYPDIMTCGMFPLAHFIEHGRVEGRQGAPDFDGKIERGEIEFDKEKPTVLIANHEASRTGAPLVGLNLARSFSEKYNVITILGDIKGIYEAFLEASCLVATGDFSLLDAEYLIRYLKSEYNAQAIILNSAETSVLAQAATNENFPSVALIHEFAEYTKPAGRIAEIVRLVDCAIVPARLLEESAQKECTYHCSGRAPNIEVYAQGSLPWLPSSKSATDFRSSEILEYLRKKAPGKSKIVLGAGHTAIRKGVDLFVQTAYELNKIRDDVAFFWVGDGYSPEHDLSYSLWVKEMIARMGLSESVHFFAPQSSLEEFYAVSDIFFLSSRLDPFPNVVVDALKSDKYVVCFQDSTGCADMFANGQAQGAAVPYCDAVEAAKAISTAINGPRPEGHNAAYAEAAFDFNTYVNFLEEKITEAIVNRTKYASSVDYLQKTGIFDPVLYVGRPAGANMKLQALRDYVAGAAKQLSRRNPARGFSENLFNSQNPGPGSMPALERAHRDSQGLDDLLFTHKSIQVGDPSNMRTLGGANFKALLHIHAHYPSEVADFVIRLNRSKVKLDIVATATSQSDFSHVEYLLSKYKGGKTTTRLVKNIGRDIGPFLTEIGSIAIQGSYDLVGHVHTKKSLGWSASAGATWKDYLLDTLIGNGPYVLKDIVALFANDPFLGLVFPEDGNNIGWSSNRPYAESLAKRFDRQLKLPDRPIFPVGNMFWARPEALKPIWNLNLTHDDLPSEPVPYDGSILHALERLTPAVCEYAGLKWSTIFVDGVMR